MTTHAPRASNGLHTPRALVSILFDEPPMVELHDRGEPVSNGWDAYILGGSSSPDEGDFDGQQRQDPTE
jgi:hypothetical protein